MQPHQTEGAEIRPSVPIRFLQPRWLVAACLWMALSSAMTMAAQPVIDAAYPWRGFPDLPRISNPVGKGGFLIFQGNKPVGSERFIIEKNNKRHRVHMQSYFPSAAKGHIGLAITLGLRGFGERLHFKERQGNDFVTLDMRRRGATLLMTRTVAIKPPGKSKDPKKPIRRTKKTEQFTERVGRTFLIPFQYATAFITRLEDLRKMNDGERRYYNAKSLMGWPQVKPVDRRITIEGLGPQKRLLFDGKKHEVRVMRVKIAGGAKMESCEVLLDDEGEIQAIDWVRDGTTYRYKPIGF
ncbi:hypothetical protein [Sulfidibacter corallicola]|uniref:Uncharacterized protein n=1 Tax=Sulfidibacter corallicola TaxID=2818388 RepID=A0A8A4TK02_SULCO|nr:hypothetical protein [Sulfidibacter corallicola]QTD49148.1 hypothetical protein J3U87_26480 [Sulfidibacter corallicola]